MQGSQQAGMKPSLVADHGAAAPGALHAGARARAGPGRWTPGALSFGHITIPGEMGATRSLLVWVSVTDTACVQAGPGSRPPGW